MLIIDNLLELLIGISSIFWSVGRSGYTVQSRDTMSVAQ